MDQKISSNKDSLGTAIKLLSQDVYKRQVLSNSCISLDKGLLVSIPKTNGDIVNPRPNNTDIMSNFK